MLRIKFPTKCIFRIFYIWKTNRMTLFCNLFMERPSYFLFCFCTCLSQFLIFGKYRSTACGLNRNNWQHSFLLLLLCAMSYCSFFPVICIALPLNFSFFLESFPQACSIYKIPAFTAVVLACYIFYCSV